jgi:hypothetical protein
MTPFTYTYHEKEWKGNYASVEKSYGWIKVFFSDHSAVILRAGIQTKNNKSAWVQVVKHEEPVWPHDLIQAIGDAVEQTEISKTGK